MKPYPARRPVVGEWVRTIDNPPAGWARILRVRRAAHRSFYNLTVDNGRERFDTVSSCWLFSETPNLQNKNRAEIEALAESLPE